MRDEERIALAGFHVDGFHNPGVEHGRAVGCRNLDEFAPGDVVFFHFFSDMLVVCQYAHGFAFGVVEGGDGRHLAIGNYVDIVVEVFAEGGFVPAFHRGQFFLDAFQVDAVDVFFQGRFFVRGIVEQFAGRVVAVKVDDVEVAAGDGLFFASCHIIKVEVHEAAFFARDDELGTVVEKYQVVEIAFGDVVLVFLAVKRGGGAHFDVGKQDFHFILVAVQADDGELLRVFCPADAGQVDIFFFAGVHFKGCAVFNVIDIDGNFGIFLACLGVFVGIVRRVEAVLFQVGSLPFEHVHLKFAYFGFIEFDVC